MTTQHSSPVTAEKTHILWATNMDDLGYADILLLVGDKPPYGVGINCGGRVIVKPLRDWHALASAPAQQPASPANAATSLADRIAAYLADAPMDGRHSDDAGANAYELLEEARYELSAPAQRAWQPIETAPLDEEVSSTCRKDQKWQPSRHMTRNAGTWLRHFLPTKTS